MNNPNVINRPWSGQPLVSPTEYEPIEEATFDPVAADVVSGRITALARLIHALSDVRGQEERLEALAEVAFKLAMENSDEPVAVKSNLTPEPEGGIVQAADRVVLA